MIKLRKELFFMITVMSLANAALLGTISVGFGWGLSSGLVMWIATILSVGLILVMDWHDSKHAERSRRARSAYCKSLGE